MVHQDEHNSNSNSSCYSINIGGYVYTLSALMGKYVFMKKKGFANKTICKTSLIDGVFTSCSRFHYLICMLMVHLRPFNS